MHDWNVVVTVRDRGFRLAREMLGEFGRIDKTEYFNVLAMHAADTKVLMESLRDEFASPFPPDFLAKVVPVTVAVEFQSAGEFETAAAETIRRWGPALAGKGFHVRMHRRGFKGRLSTQDEEQLLGGLLLESAGERTPAHITYTDPDAIVVVETIGQRAGMSLWTREDLTRYPFLGLK